MARLLGTRLIRRRAEQEAPCHCIWQRSGVTTFDRKVLRMREHASLGARRERDVTEPSHSFPEVGPGGTDCAVELLDGGGGNEPHPQETQSGESHAKSRREQQERGNTHSTQRGCLVRGRDPGRRRE